MTDAPEQGDLVRLEAHPRAPPVAEPATGQFGRDVVGVHRQAGRQALDDDDQGAPVRLSGGQVAQHAAQTTGPLPEPSESVAGSPPSGNAASKDLRVEGVLPFAVVGDIDHLGQLGNLFEQRGLDPLSQRHLGHGASLAASREA